MCYNAVFLGIWLDEPNDEFIGLLTVALILSCKNKRVLVLEDHNLIKKFHLINGQRQSIYYNAEKHIGIDKFSTKFAFEYVDKKEVYELSVIGKFQFGTANNGLRVNG